MLPYKMVVRERGGKKNDSLPSFFLNQQFITQGTKAVHGNYKVATIN